MDSNISLIGMENQKKDEIKLISDHNNSGISQQIPPINEHPLETETLKEVFCQNCRKSCKNEALEKCGKCMSYLCIDCLDSNLNCKLCHRDNIQTECSKVGKNEEYLSNKREVLSLEVNIKKNDSGRKSKEALN